MPSNNLLLRASCDKVHAPDCLGGIGVGAHALQVRLVAAEQARWAPICRCACGEVTYSP